MSAVLTAVAIMTGLGVFFAAVLAAAYRFLRVWEDPRLETVTDLLPGTNCGACGEPGCGAFAVVLLAGTKSPGDCTVSSEEGRGEIASFLGVEVGGSSKRVARLKCAGGVGRVVELAAYRGTSTCRAAEVVDGGGRGCVYGCLGLADCERACTFDAIHMNAQKLPVVDVVACTSCGDCVDVCPKDLFVLQALDRPLFVQCNSPLAGEEARLLCEVACDACGRCAADSPPGVVTMKNGLPIIDWDQDESPTPKATWRCPTDAIQWVEGDQFQTARDPFLDLEPAPPEVRGA